MIPLLSSCENWCTTKYSRAQPYTHYTLYKHTLCAHRKNPCCNLVEQKDSVSHARCPLLHCSILNGKWMEDGWVKKSGQLKLLNRIADGATFNGLDKLYCVKRSVQCNDVCYIFYAMHFPYDAITHCTLNHWTLNTRTLCANKI